MYQVEQKYIKHILLIRYIFKNSLGVELPINELDIKEAGRITYEVVKKSNLFFLESSIIPLREANLCVKRIDASTTFWLNSLSYEEKVNIFYGIEYLLWVLKNVEDETMRDYINKYLGKDSLIKVLHLYNNINIIFSDLTLEFLMPTYNILGCINNPINNRKYIKALLKEENKIFQTEGNTNVKDLRLYGERECEFFPPTHEELKAFYADHIRFRVHNAIIQVEENKSSRMNTELFKKIKALNVSELEHMKNLTNKEVYDLISYVDCDSEKVQFETYKSYMNDKCIDVITYFDEGIHSGTTISKYFSSICNGTVRIYINTPYSVTGYKFLSEFILKCESYNVNYKFKGFHTRQKHEKNKTILYVPIEEIRGTVIVLEEIKKEHPEWIRKFGNCPYSCARFNDSYYGIVHFGAYSNDLPYENKEGVTYNTYFSDLAEAAFYSLLAEKLIEYGIITNSDDLKKAKDIANITNLEAKNIRNHSVWNLKFKYIKSNNGLDLLERNIPMIQRYAKATGINIDHNDYNNVVMYRDKIRCFHNLTQYLDRDLESNVSLSEFMYNYIEIEKNRSSLKKDG